MGLYLKKTTTSHVYVIIKNDVSNIFFYRNDII